MDVRPGSVGSQHGMARVRRLRAVVDRRRSVASAAPRSAGPDRSARMVDVPAHPVLSRPMTAAGVRRVGVVVVNYNGGEMVAKCVRALLASQWSGSLEVVVVDNGSTDDSISRIDGARVIALGTNAGYGVANNVGLRALTHVDAVALVNPDAFVTPGWLAPLAAALEVDASVGAACPKILLAPAFCEVRLSSLRFVPGGVDQRTLGQRVVGVMVDGSDVFDDCVFRSGWSWPEDHARWTTGEAVLYVPVAAGATSVDIAIDGAETQRFDVGERFDVINNVGNELTPDWYGRDRGFLEIDRGQYDAPEEVWGWCGAAVLLSRAYLDATVGFDERFFLYYEDVEWSWRGHKQGWRYAYVPTSVVRHEHSASTGEGSALFDHLNQRNRLMVLAMHAPRAEAAQAWMRYGSEVGRCLWGEGIDPLLHGRRPHLNVTKRRMMSGIGALRRLPEAVRGRR